jgi:hypothetical protein
VQIGWSNSDESGRIFQEGCDDDDDDDDDDVKATVSWN